jgi:hypothetical protein
MKDQELEQNTAIHNHNTHQKLNPFVTLMLLKSVINMGK